MEEESSWRPALDAGKAALVLIDDVLEVLRGNLLGGRRALACDGSEADLLFMMESC